MAAQGAESRHRPEPAPEVIMDSNGAYWRRYPEHLSMCPVSTDNEPLATPVAVYQFVGWEGKHDALAGDCICAVRGPDPDDTMFDPACPLHGNHGSMVAVVRRV